MLKRKTNNEFIEKSKSIHGERYDYSLANYINSSTKVKIICPEHGEFEQIPNNHLFGYGCQRCARDLTGLKKRTTHDDFIKKANQIHNNKYDYSLVNYKNSKTKVKIICPEHGEFEQTPSNHLSGKGCNKCSVKERNDKFKLTLEQFIQNAKKHHGNKYNYSKVNLISRELPVEIICPVHGAFNQVAKLHSSRGNGCPHCKESKGEKIIRSILLDSNINFIAQHKFSDCKHYRVLPFDFYLPNNNVCIEFDGEQHFEPIKCFGGDKRFTKQKVIDTIKTNYCKKNNIKLIRIPYYENRKEIIRKIHFSIT